MYELTRSSSLLGWWLGKEAERQDGPLLTETTWDTLYRKTGFSGLDGSVQLHGDGHIVESVMLATAIPKEKPSYPAASLLVCDEAFIGLGETIGRSLHKRTGLPASVGKLLEVDLSDKYGILLAMDEPLLSELDEIGFRRMQVLFSTARGILWVSRGARSQNPEAK